MPFSRHRPFPTSPSGRCSGCPGGGRPLGWSRRGCPVGAAPFCTASGPRPRSPGRYPNTKRIAYTVNTAGAAGEPVAAGGVLVRVRRPAGRRLWAAVAAFSFPAGGARASSGAARAWRAGACRCGAWPRLKVIRGRRGAVLKELRPRLGDPLPSRRDFGHGGCAAFAGSAGFGARCARARSAVILHAGTLPGDGFGFWLRGKLGPCGYGGVVGGQLVGRLRGFGAPLGATAFGRTVGAARNRVTGGPPASEWDLCGGRGLSRDPAPRLPSGSGRLTRRGATATSAPTQGVMHFSHERSAAFGIVTQFAGGVRHNFAAAAARRRTRPRQIVVGYLRPGAAPTCDATVWI